MNIADEILREYEEVFSNLPHEGEGQLRFGRSMVSISNIAGQFYCEQKLDLESEYPIPPTEQMKTGGEQVTRRLRHWELPFQKSRKPRRLQRHWDSLALSNP